MRRQQGRRPTRVSQTEVTTLNLRLVSQLIKVAIHKEARGSRGDGSLSRDGGRREHSLLWLPRDAATAAHVMIAPRAWTGVPQRRGRVPCVNILHVARARRRREKRGSVLRHCHCLNQKWCAQPISAPGPPLGHDSQWFAHAPRSWPSLRASVHPARARCCDAWQDAARS